MEDSSMKAIQVYRVINAAFWAIVLAAVLVAVCRQWSANGCEANSILLAVAYYSTGCVGLGLIIDQHLREQLKRYK